MAHHYAPYSSSGRQALANLTHETHNRSNRQSPLHCDHMGGGMSPTMGGMAGGIHLPDPSAFAMPGYLQPHMFSGPQVSDPAMLMLGGSPLSASGNSPTAFPLQAPYHSAPSMGGAPAMLGSPQQAAALATAAAAAAGVQVPAQLSLADLELFTRMTTQIYQTMMSAQQAAAAGYAGTSPLMPGFGSQPSFDAYSSNEQQHASAGYASAAPSHLNSAAAPFVAGAAAASSSSAGTEFQSMLSSMLNNGPAMFDPSHEPVVATDEDMKEMAEREAAIHGTHGAAAVESSEKSPEAKAPVAVHAFDSAIISAHVASASEKSYADAVTPMALKRFIAPASRATSTSTVAAKKATPAATVSSGRSLSQASTVVALFEAARSPAPKSGSKSSQRQQDKTASVGRTPPKKLRMVDDEPAAPAAAASSQTQTKPSEGASTAVSSQFVEVELSRKQRVRVHVAFAVNIGDTVVFEGDRGFDAGRVVGTLPEPSSDAASSPSRSRRSVPRAIRIASASEVAQIEALGVEGEKAIPVCQQAVDRMGLNLKITDAQFQFDRKKLTFFYDATDRVDFRDLLHEMYGSYKCRIWMARTEEKNLPSLE